MLVRTGILQRIFEVLCFKVFSNGFIVRVRGEVRVGDKVGKGLRVWVRDNANQFSLQTFSLMRTIALDCCHFGRP